MYIPKHFEESRPEQLHALMAAHPLATLVIQSPEGLDAHHIPLHLQRTPAPFGVLRGHIARANPLAAMPGASAGCDALAIFHGPSAYVSPSWYPGKREHGRVVPTWNYVVVHAHGRLRLIDDAAWLRQQLEALTDANEARFAQPWAVADAPEDYLERMMRAIVGVELQITRLSGKWKLSQNHPPENHAGVVAGLQGSDLAEDRQVAALMAAR